MHLKKMDLSFINGQSTGMARIMPTTLIVIWTPILLWCGLISDQSKKSELCSVSSENGQLPPRSGICSLKRPFVCHALWTASSLSALLVLARLSSICSRVSGSFLARHHICHHCAHPNHAIHSKVPASLCASKQTHVDWLLPGSSRPLARTHCSLLSMHFQFLPQLAVMNKLFMMEFTNSRSKLCEFPLRLFHPMRKTGV